MWYREARRCGSWVRSTGVTRLLLARHYQGLGRQPLNKALPANGDCHSHLLPQLPLTAFRPYTTSSPQQEDFKLVYSAPLKGAIRAVKLFSLCTAVSASIGGPVLVILGNPGVPLAGRLAISSIVVLVGLSTTAILHWLTKGYVIRMLYNAHTQMAAAYTLSLIALIKRNEFHLSESGPPPSTAGFSSFQARGKSYFLHSETFEDRQLLGQLIGSYEVPGDTHHDKDQ